MADPRRFLHARIGRIDEWTVRAEVVDGALRETGGAAGVTSFRRWVRLEERRGDLYAHMDNARLRLYFTRRAEGRRVRSELAGWSRPFVAHLELTGIAHGMLEGLLVVMRTALPAVLPGAPSIVLAPSLLDSIDESVRPRMDQLADEAVLPSGDGPVMVVTTPLLLGTAADREAARVLVHLDRRWRLDCDVVGEPGAQHLVVREIKTSGSAATIPDGRLIAIPGAPRFVATAADVRAVALVALLPRRHPVIAAWIAYEELAQDRSLRAADERRGHPLEYTEIAEGPRGPNQLFHVVLAAPQEAREHWIDPRAQQRRTVRVKAAVDLVDLDERTDPIGCELVSFDDKGGGGLHATIKLPGDGRIPPIRGRLLAKEDPGHARQRERRKRAIDRLRSGMSANPELLGWLMEPAIVPVVNLGARAGTSIAGLDEHQRRAVALATRTPSIVLVLGPPGSGKTTVIRAIVDEYRRRLERASTSDAPAPFRILVTSIENEAVDNVAEKLGTDGAGGAAGIEIWHIGDRQRRGQQRETRAADARRIAAELWKDLRDSPRFTTYQRLHQLRDTLGLVQRALFEVGVGAELAGRFQELAAATERLALTPLLGEQLGVLAGRLARWVDAPAPDDRGTPTAETESRLVPVFGRLARGPSEVAAEGWPDLAAELDAVYAVVSAPMVEDRPWIDLAERWSDLRRVLRRPARRDLSADHDARLAALRADTIGALAAAAESSSPAPISSPPADLVAAVHSWVQRATALVEDELADKAHHEEAVLYRWTHTLAEEPAELSRMVEHHALVTAATCQQVDQERQAPPEFDVVIVDEAARAGIDVLIPMTLGKSIVLVGDHRQLPPHIEDDLASGLDEGLREQIDLKRESLFSWLWGQLPRANVVALKRQYRMHEDIGRAVSRLFYEPELVLTHHHADERAAARRPVFGLCDNQPLVWVDTSDVLQDPVARTAAQIATGPCVEHNEYEARLIAQLLRRVDRRPLVEWRDREGRQSVGVISFYKEQITQLRALLERDLDPELFALVRLGSVDAFQGREFPLVILSVVRSNRDGFVGFLRLPNRINVAMSRAQRQLIIVGDSHTVAARNDRGSPHLRRLFDEVSSGQAQGWVIASRAVER